MSTVVYFKDAEQLPNALDEFDLRSFSHQSVPVKLHMGEMKNKYFPRPVFVKQVIDYLIDHEMQPFLTDTTVAYNAPRKSKSGYKKVAYLHGFSKKKIGCEVVIDDQGVPVEVEGRNYEVADHLHKASCIVAISHVKGHVASGFGGAIKNFGMGGVTKETKKRMHHGAKPVYTKDKCTFCGICAEVCPFNAITIKDNEWEKSERKCFGCGVCVDNCKTGGLQFEDASFQFVLACACKACVQSKQVLYINDVNRIARSCDCDPFSGPIICPDVGYVVGMDPVAVDTVSLDLIDKQKDQVFYKEHHVDPRKQILFGEQIGLGSRKYSLKEL